MKDRGNCEMSHLTDNRLSLRRGGEFPSESQFSKIKIGISRTYTVSNLPRVLRLLKANAPYFSKIFLIAQYSG